MFLIFKSTATTRMVQSIRRIIVDILWRKINVVYDEIVQVFEVNSTATDTTLRRRWLTLQSIEIWNFPLLKRNRHLVKWYAKQYQANLWLRPIMADRIVTLHTVQYRFKVGNLGSMKGRIDIADNVDELPPEFMFAYRSEQKSKLDSSSPPMPGSEHWAMIRD